MLPLRPFGSTGFAVSPLALGTVKLGRTRGLKYPTGFTIPDDREALRLLATARDLGINMLDTAPAYGVSEERLGHLLGTTRHDWVICTKAGEEFDNETGSSRFDFTPEHIRASVARSLRRLRTDILDIVLIHCDAGDLDAITRYGALDCLHDLKREGKLRAAGASTKTVAGGMAAIEGGDCAMVTYNPAERSDEAVIDRAAGSGKAILVKKVLASGHLATGTAQGAVADAFRFSLSRGGVTSIVTGTIDPDHLRQNAEACASALAA